MSPPGLSRWNHDWKRPHVMNEHEFVVLKRSLNDEGLLAGDVGFIVAVYEGGRAYEVEFCRGDGTTFALLALNAEDIRHRAPDEILHGRSIRF